MCAPRRQSSFTQAPTLRRPERPASLPPMSVLAPSFTMEPLCLRRLASRGPRRRWIPSQWAASFGNSRSQDRWPQLKALHRGRSRSGTDVEPNASNQRSPQQGPLEIRGQPGFRSTAASAVFATPQFRRTAAPAARRTAAPSFSARSFFDSRTSPVPLYPEIGRSHRIPALPPNRPNPGFTTKSAGITVSRFTGKSAIITKSVASPALALNRPVATIPR